ncbi:MAG: hypothetical protein GY805_20185 [Chloroflexi bacterium]|nr:hypothetical protein [Chloroflexota bacterium]
MKTLTAELEARLLTERNIWLATVRPSCRPHLIPIWFISDIPHPKKANFGRKEYQNGGMTEKYSTETIEHLGLVHQLQVK